MFNLNQIPSDTQIREIIDGTHSDFSLQRLFSRLQRDKHLQKYQLFQGLYLCSVEGTQYYHFKEIHCGGVNCATFLGYYVRTAII